METKKKADIYASQKTLKYEMVWFIHQWCGNCNEEEWKCKYENQEEVHIGIGHVIQ